MIFPINKNTDSLFKACLLTCLSLWLTWGQFQNFECTFLWKGVQLATTWLCTVLFASRLQRGVKGTLFQTYLGWILFLTHSFTTHLYSFVMCIPFWVPPQPTDISRLILNIQYEDIHSIAMVLILPSHSNLEVFPWMVLPLSTSFSDYLLFQGKMESSLLTLLVPETKSEFLLEEVSLDSASV